MTTKEQLDDILKNKQKYIDEKNYNEACKWREKEVSFMMENFGIDVRSEFVKNFEKNLPTNIVGIIKIIQISKN